MMKKILLSLSAVALCAMSMGAEALTVYDGPNTSQYVPIYGYWYDNYVKCEYVIPAADLTDLKGNAITALTWYLESPAGKAFPDNQVQIFVKEIESATISAFQGQDGAAMVYEGGIDATGTELTITFAEPYEYQDGNLLIGVYNPVKGAYSSTSFYGTTVEGASVEGHSGSSMDVTVNQRNFIPKTTLTYEPAVKLDYDAKVTPAALDFGKINPGQTATLNVTLKNRGANAFTPAITLEAPFSTTYQAAELAAGASVEIPVAFAPTALGDYSGTMTIAYGGEAPLTVDLTGHCVNEAELTVADGTSTSTYVPVYGNYFDVQGTTSQMIYPADMFASLPEGANIVGVKFYSRYTMHLTDGTYQLSVGSTETTEFVEDNNGVTNPVTGLTAVATTDPVDGATTLEFNFTEPYKYEGGNLTVETLVTVAGEYNSESFVGIKPGYFASRYQYTGSWGDANYGVDFLPKMTVIYTMPVDEPETYTVSGNVVDNNGEALEAVAVTMTVTMPAAEGAPRLAAEPVTYTATTDAEGNFAIEMTPVDGATYTLAFAKEGYKDQTIDYNLDDEVRVIMQPDSVTGVTSIEAAQNGKVVYVNPMGQTSDRPFQGVNIVVSNGKAIGKVVR